MRRDRQIELDEVKASKYLNSQGYTVRPCFKEKKDRKKRREDFGIGKEQSPNTTV